MEKRQRAATESGVLLLIVAGILVAVNALSALGGYVRKDTTKQERFTLSKGSANLLHSLKEPMKAEAYVTKGLPKLDAFVRDLRDLLQEYKDKGGGHFDYEIIEANSEEQKKAAKDAGLVEQPFGEASETDEQKGAVAQGFMGIVLKYGAEKDARLSGRGAGWGRSSGPRTPPSSRTVSSSGSRTRSASFATAGTTSSTRSASSPVTTRSSSVIRTWFRRRWASRRCSRSSRRTFPSTRSRTSI